MRGGRRGGKSRIAAVVAVYLAALGHGEKATVAVIAADRQQARVVFRYVTTLLDLPLLSRLDRAGCPPRHEVHTCSFRTTRGYSFAAVIPDEIGHVNPVRISPSARP